MSNTALYQCSACGYSTNNPVAFALHPCRPSNGVNWNSRYAAIVLALLLALATMLPAKAQDVPQPQPTPTVGGGPSVAVEHKVFLPMIVAPEDGPEGQGRYWGGQAEHAGYVSWRPSGS